MEKVAGIVGLQSILVTGMPHHVRDLQPDQLSITNRADYASSSDSELKIDLCTLKDTHAVVKTDEDKGESPPHSAMKHQTKMTTAYLLVL